MGSFKSRRTVVAAAIILVFAVIAFRLFQVQILDKEYRITAENNALKYETIYPARGRILDRNGQVIVDNKISYDIMVTPFDVKEFDTLAFCRIFDLDTAFVKDKFREYRLYRRKIGYQSLVFKRQVTSEQYNMFIEKSFLFPGFTGVPRTSRSYPYEGGGNLFGYISEVDADYIKDHPEYKSGDYVGKTGMEEAYETLLRGEKGYNIYLRDAHNRIKEHYKDGEYDKTAVAGTDVTTTIDGTLQAYGEQLMRGKVGSLVAIEPATGEILTMVSSPGIDVNQLSDISKYYKDIVTDPYKPMFNRAVMSPQPPGSVFKLVNGLIGLQEGVLTPETLYGCHRGYVVGNLRVGCHGHPSPINMYQSIMMSCNAYYCYVFRSILDNPKYDSVQEGFEHWKAYTESFGFGTKLGTDIPGEKAGTMPTVEAARPCTWPTWPQPSPTGAGSTRPTCRKIRPPAPSTTVSRNGITQWSIPRISRRWSREWSSPSTIPAAAPPRRSHAFPGSSPAAKRVPPRTPTGTTTRSSSPSPRRTIRRSPWWPMWRTAASVPPGLRPSLRCWWRNTSRARFHPSGRRWKSASSTGT